MKRKILLSITSVILIIAFFLPLTNGFFSGSLLETALNGLDNDILYSLVLFLFPVTALIILISAWIVSGTNALRMLRFVKLLPFCFFLYMTFEIFNFTRGDFPPGFLRDTMEMLGIGFYLTFIGSLTLFIEAFLRQTKKVD